MPTNLFPQGPRDAHVQVVEEVGAAAQPQHVVGQLQSEMRRLAELASCKQSTKEAQISILGEKNPSINPQRTTWYTSTHSSISNKNV